MKADANKMRSGQSKDINKFAYYWVAIGAVVCMLSVIIGAFAAHGLKTLVSEYQLGIVNTGAKYQMYHGFALIVTSLIALKLRFNLTALNTINGMFIAGVVMFSGSLYILGLSGSTSFVYITPLGGLAFIIGWLYFAICSFLKAKHT